MKNIGNNVPCPCGSGKKYKRCCKQKEVEMRKKQLASGKFQFEPGSYSVPGGFLPSLLCYKQESPQSWEPHFCLVKYDEVFTDEDSASEMATDHLNAAFGAIHNGGDATDLAMSLRYEGYKNIEDFVIASD